MVTGNARWMLFTAALLTGCATRQAAVWRVNGPSLVPPGKLGPVVLKTRGDCPTADAITPRRKGTRMLLTVDPDTLSRQAPGWLATWSWHAAERGCAPDW